MEASTSYNSSALQEYVSSIALAAQAKQIIAAPDVSISWKVEMLVLAVKVWGCSERCMYKTFGLLGNRILTGLHSSKMEGDTENVQDSLNTLINKVDEMLHEEMLRPDSEAAQSWYNLKCLMNKFAPTPDSIPGKLSNDDLTVEHRLPYNTTLFIPWEPMITFKYGMLGFSKKAKKGGPLAAAGREMLDKKKIQTTTPEAMKVWYKMTLEIAADSVLPLRYAFMLAVEAMEAGHDPTPHIADLVAAAVVLGANLNSDVSYSRKPRAGQTRRAKNYFLHSIHEEDAMSSDSSPEKDAPEAAEAKAAKAAEVMTAWMAPAVAAASTAAAAAAGADIAEGNYHPDFTGDMHQSINTLVHAISGQQQQLSAAVGYGAGEASAADISQIEERLCQAAYWLDKGMNVYMVEG